jgi:hypothetical protein
MDLVEMFLIAFGSTLILMGLGLLATMGGKHR